MMFAIGLEMHVDKLWAMRRSIFGYGSNAALAWRVIDQRLSSLVTSVVALSMFRTPLLLLAQRRFWQPHVADDPI